jgi:ribonuclease HII
VAKLPKNVNPKQYNLETMKKDIETMIICSHIVNEYNERIIGISDSKLLTEFVHSYIYEFTNKDVAYKLAYVENFI